MTSHKFFKDKNSILIFTFEEFMLGATIIDTTGKTVTLEPHYLGFEAKPIKVDRVSSSFTGTAMEQYKTVFYKASNNTFYSYSFEYKSSGGVSTTVQYGSESNGELIFTPSSLVSTTNGSDDRDMNLYCVPGLNRKYLVLEYKYGSYGYGTNWLFDTTSKNFWGGSYNRAQYSSYEYYSTASYVAVLEHKSFSSGSTIFPLYRVTSSSWTAIQGQRPADYNYNFIGASGNTVYIMLTHPTVSNSMQIAKCDLVSRTFTYDIINGVNRLDYMITDGSSVMFRAKGTNGKWTTKFIKCDVSDITPSLFIGMTFDNSIGVLSASNLSYYIGDYGNYSYWVDAENVDPTGVKRYPIYLTKVDNVTLTWSRTELKTDAYPEYPNIDCWPRYGEKKKILSDLNNLVPCGYVVVDTINYCIYPLNGVLSSFRRVYTGNYFAVSLGSLFFEDCNIYLSSGSVNSRNGVYSYVIPIESNIPNYFYYGKDMFIGGKPKYIYLNKDV